ncbi:hypothetical protein JW756_00840 [Candidatus Woesearchaeota archaeon]|nr:hypothetical protein [Candidatus Woesearchaeota archaeon]
MSKEDKDSEVEEGEGEVMAFMEDLEEDSKSMMQDLMDIDGMLLNLQERVELKNPGKEEILKDIESIRFRIGVLEKKDRIELSEEEEVETLLDKLKKWVDRVM